MGHPIGLKIREIVYNVSSAGEKEDDAEREQKFLQWGKFSGKYKTDEKRCPRYNQIERP